MNEQTIKTENGEENPVSLADLEGRKGSSSRIRPKGSFKKKAVLFSGLILLATITFLGGYFLLRSEKIDLKANKRLAAKLSSGADIRQAAFDSIRDSLPAPSPPPSPGGPSTITPISKNNSSLPHPYEPVGKEQVAPPIDSAAASTLAPPVDFQSNRPARSSETNSTNHDQLSKTSASKTNMPATTRASVRFAAIPQLAARDRELIPATQSQPERYEAEKMIFNTHRTIPPAFGAMLPVRLMGVVYTIRSGSLARFELMRDLKTEQWQMKRGTVFVGNVSGSGADRAFIQIKGFIDPATERFIKIEGEILGEDGGAGLRGRTRRVASVWGKALDRAARAGLQIATSILNRGASSVIIAADPYGAIPSVGDRSVIDGNTNRSFVEVPAGAVGFIMVTTLPKAEDSNSHLANNIDRKDEITDRELAELMLSADPNRIRAAMPRMSLELQRVAEMTLKEIEPATK
jgi:hypothetical protein